MPNYYSWKRNLQNYLKKYLDLDKNTSLIFRECLGVRYPPSLKKEYNIPIYYEYIVIIDNILKENILRIFNFF